MKFNPSGNVRFCVHFEHLRGISFGDGTLYGHVRLYPEYHVDGKRQYYFPDEDRALYNIKITSQYDDKNGDPYAVKLECTEVSDLESAQDALAVQRKVNQYILKHHEGYEYSTRNDLGKFLVATCKALNISAVGIPSGSYPTAERHWYSPEEAAEKIAAMVEEDKNSHMARVDAR